MRWPEAHRKPHWWQRMHSTGCQQVTTGPEDSKKGSLHRFWRKDGLLTPWLQTCSHVVLGMCKCLSRVHVLDTWSQLVVLFCEAVEPLGGGTLLEEVGHWGFIDHPASCSAFPRKMPQCTFPVQWWTVSPQTGRQTLSPVHCFCYISALKVTDTKLKEGANVFCGMWLGRMSGPCPRPFFLSNFRLS